MKERSVADHLRDAIAHLDEAVDKEETRLQKAAITEVRRAATMALASALLRDSERPIDADI